LCQLGRLNRLGAYVRREVSIVAKNTRKGYREGAVRDRSQPETAAGWVRRDSDTGRFMDVKSDGEPFQGSPSGASRRGLWQGVK